MYETHIHHHAASPAEPPAALLTAYYGSLAAECRRLPLGIIDTKFVSTTGEDAVPLTDIYVDLDVFAHRAPESGDEKGWAARAVRGEGSDRTPCWRRWMRPRTRAPCCWAMLVRARPPSSTT